MNSFPGKFPGNIVTASYSNVPLWDRAFHSDDKLRTCITMVEPKSLILVIAVLRAGRGCYDQAFVMVDNKLGWLGMASLDKVDK